MAGTLTFREETYALGTARVDTLAWQVPDMSSRGQAKIALGGPSGTYA